MDLMIVFAVTFLVRIFSVMVGGGRNVLLPMLILLGLSPSEAVATQKFGGISSVFSLIKFHQHNLVNWKVGIRLIIPIIIGASMGAYLLVVIDQVFFKKIIGISILISSLYILFRKKNKKKKITNIKKSPLGSYLLAFFGAFIGGWLGFRGFILRYLYISMGMSFIEATATKRFTSIFGDIFAVIIMIINLLVNWPIAIAMFVAGGLGAWVGAILGIKIGNDWVERIFIVIVAIGAIKIFL